MEIHKIIYPVIAVITVFFSATGNAAESEELKLAKIYGCMACHAMIPQKATTSGKPVQPVGPSFKEIAERFHANKDEGKYQELYRIVKYGSSPFRSKWQGKVSGLAMPPNDETMPDLDINRLLVWILSMDKPVK